MAFRVELKNVDVEALTFETPDKREWRLVTVKAAGPTGKGFRLFESVPSQKAMWFLHPKVAPLFGGFKPCTETKAELVAHLVMDHHWPEYLAAAAVVEELLEGPKQLEEHDAPNGESWDCWADVAAYLEAIAS